MPLFLLPVFWFGYFDGFKTGSSLLANICPTQECFLGVLKRMQANRAQGDEGCSIDIACVTTAHSVFLIYIEKLGM